MMLHFSVCLLQFVLSLLFASTYGENCSWNMLFDLNITYCGWDTNNPPKRYGNEVSGLEGVYNFTDELHVIHGKHGTKYVVRKDNAVVAECLQELGSEVLAIRAWEDSFQNEILRIMTIINQTQDSLYIDVGSNVGVWSIFMSKAVGPTGFVLSFEPQIELTYQHSASLLLNNIKNNQIINAFVSNSVGYSSISTVQDALSVGTQKYNYGIDNLSRLMGSSDKKQRFSVPSLLLDQLFYRDHVISKCPSFIKMDIESFEVHAILGGEQMLRECMPVLFIEAECVYLLRTLFTVLDDMGYTLAWMFLPFIDVTTPFNGRYVNIFQEGHTQKQHSIELGHLYISRNIIAVPKAYSELLSSQDYYIIIDIHKERQIDSNTWHSLDIHNKWSCTKTKVCSKWIHPQPPDPIITPSHLENATENNSFTHTDKNTIFRCNELSSVLENEIVFYYKKYYDEYK